MIIPGSNSSGGIRGQRQNPSSVPQNALQQLSGLGAQISQVVQQNRSRADHDAVIEAQNKIANEANSFKQEELTKEGKDALGAYKRYEEKYKSIVSESMSGLSERAKKNLNHWSESRFATEKTQFYKHEHSQKNMLAKNNYSERLTTIQEEVRMNPFAFQEADKALEEAVIMGMGSGAIKKSELQQELTQNKNKLRNYAMMEMYSADKDQAINGIDQMGFGEGEKKKWLDKFEADKEREEREFKQKNRLDRDLVMESVPGMEAIAQEHGDTSKIKEAVVKLGELGYEKEGRKLTKLAEAYDKSYPVITKVNSLPIKDAVTLVQKLNVGRDESTADDELHVRTLARNALQKRVQKYQKDPVSMIQEKAGGATPEEQVSARLKLQEEQGITVKGGFRALSNAEALELKNRFEQSNTAQKVQLLQEINDPEKGYGKHKGQVLKEMGIPQGALMAQYFPAGKTQELILSAATTKDPEILNSDRKADYRDKALSSDFVTMLSEVQSIMPQDVGFNKAAESIKNTMINAAVMTGDSDQAREIFDDNFSVLNDSSIKAFIPKEVDEDDVELHLEDKRSQLIKEMTQGQEQFRQREVTQLIKQGVWVNNKDGFVLVDQVSGKAFDSYVPLDEVEERASTKFNDVVSASMAKY